jgi:hypothetical protein
MKIADICRLGILRKHRILPLVLFALLSMCGHALCQESNTSSPASSNDTGKQTKPAGEMISGSSQSQGKIKVVFDDNSPGVVFIESNGEKIRVDTAKKTVEPIIAGSTENRSAEPENKQTPAKTAAVKKDKDDNAYDFDKGEEPYDYRVVNVPTPKMVPKGTWNLVFTHRFTQTINPLSSSAKNLFGLDSFGVASFGVTYGITDKLYISAYRSPLCQRGVCRTIEAGLGYNWIAHDKDSPIAFTTYASIEGNDNFTEEYTYNLQARVSGRIGKRVYLFFSPAVHINSNGQRRFDPRPTDYFPPAAVADSFRLPTHGASFGFGATVLITPNVVALFDFTPRTGFKLGQVTAVRDTSFRVIGFTNESHPSIGFGIQRNIGKHAFALTFSNTQTTTTSRYNSSNLVLSPKNLIIGFNLSRRF